MCLLLETIKLEDGKFANLEYHNRRLNASRHELFGCTKPINLEGVLNVPHNSSTGLFRCRVLYQQEIESVQFIPQPIRTFNSLKVIEANELDYHLKYADRSQLTELLNQREQADEIILVKNGLITDCTIANLVFGDGHQWVTPDSPLLCGTQRQRLLETGSIKKKTIKLSDLSEYREVGLINAFFDLKNMPLLKTSRIF